jgi:cytochrome c553
MTHYSVFSLLCLILLPTGVFAAGDPAAGLAKSQPCVACHNTDGNSVNPIWPKIAGQYEAYLVKQLKELRAGDKGPRNDPVMSPMAANLTDQDIADLSAYFAKQKQTLGKAQQASVALGEQIYRGGDKANKVTACIACHGPDGSGNGAANFPRLGGQHAQYIDIQLHAFKDGKRKNSAGEMMTTISHHLSEEQIKAVSSYIEGLH